MWLDGGTTGDRMIDFINAILAEIGLGTIQRRRCFILGNLNSHHNIHMAALIFVAGHRLDFRAPY